MVEGVAAPESVKPVLEHFEVTESLLAVEARPADRDAGDIGLLDLGFFVGHRVSPSASSRIKAAHTSSSQPYWNPTRSSGATSTTSPSSTPAQVATRWRNSVTAAAVWPFIYWLFAADSSVWKILPITTCFRNDAPASQPVFTRAALAKLGLNPELIVRLLQKQGARPVVG